MRVKPKALSITTLCVILFACSRAPSPTASPAPSAVATFTPSPTSTPEPTATLLPSATPSPTRTPLVSGLGEVIFSESFDDLDFQGLFGFYGPSRIESGAVVMDREEGYVSPPDMWPTNGIYAQFGVPPGMTTLVLFKAAKGTNFHLGYIAEEGGAGAAVRFDFNWGFAVWELYGGPAGQVRIWHSHQPRLELWHYFSIKRTADGTMEARLWEKDNPEAIMEFRENLGEEWGTYTLTFFLHLRGGSVMVDEYQDLR